MLAVTMTLYGPGVVPTGTEIVRFDFAVPPPGTVTELGLKLVMRVEGEDDRVTGPAKLPRLVTEIVELAFEPCGMLSDEGFEETPKSGPLTVKLPNIDAGW